MSPFRGFRELQSEMDHLFGETFGRPPWARELLEEQVRRIEEAGGKVAKAYLRTGEPDAEVVSPG